ncbi:L,D-transpeptidase catalytic domain protein [Acuticoccus sp. M5D2P5]|uniref:L,D-transpeptidase family protein n=1 Tax=Acuticoccus kalidii TaxID=2910977 RepID=UPI001F22BA71|nr:L,D-transpeptidase family protein [Acuticoccus kalidii]MCF3932126.1 L,D-transpeptidase catalytic domain protein [Acuticoccus kalidii]
MVRPAPGRPRQAILTCAGRNHIVAIGRGGIKTLKREGDGASPRARIVPLALLTRSRAMSPIPTRRVGPADGWGDDLGRFATYNRACRLPEPGSHERLMREDALYDYVMVTDHNQRPRVVRGGSAIFIHVARPGLTPTEGCIAFPAALWRRAMVPIGPYVIGENTRRARR